MTPKTSITEKDITSLLGDVDAPCVSLFVPGDADQGFGSRQGQIRLRNMTSSAEVSLENAGLRQREIDTLLRPARELAGHSEFWRGFRRGLAMFLSPEIQRAFRLPGDIDELVMVGRRFHTKPLLQLLTHPASFYILALDSQSAVLHRCNHLSADPVFEVSSAEPEEDGERPLQFHTGTSPGPGKRAAQFHGHDAEDQRAEADLLRHFRKVDQKVGETIEDDRYPVVLAVPTHLEGMYRAEDSTQRLLDESLTLNPESLSRSELHRKAYEILERWADAARAEAAEALGSIQDRSNGRKVSYDVKEIVPASAYGRVDTLFVASGVHVWGAFFPETDRVEVVEEKDPQSIDLLDLAAAHGFLKGGKVFVVERDQVPGGDTCAALFRY